MALHDPSTFDKSRHTKYFLRCLKTYLPSAYTVNDSQRMTLAFFTVSALDILGSLETETTLTERQAYIEWIYGCQHPDGGFRGFTGTDMADKRSPLNAHWDPANIAATYFALAALLVLGDDLQRVARRKCLLWIKKLQLEDGAFGEALEEDGRVQGARDVRFCMCATGIRWMLRRDGQDSENSTPDIDVEQLATFVRAAQMGFCKTYEGGFGRSPFEEAHAGWTYCAVSTLSLLGESPPSPPLPQQSKNSIIKDRSSSERLLKWLTSLQTSRLHEDDFCITDPETTPTTIHPPEIYLQGISSPLSSETSHLYINGSYPDPEEEDEEDPTDEFQYAGLSGRCNKLADTCYAFWAGGPLAVIPTPSLFLLSLLRSVQLIFPPLPDAQSNPPTRSNRPAPIPVGKDAASDWRVWENAWRSSW
ncbi:MAG: hypothetical protein Q9190_000697 [Brigantiaea leucoxantha]